LKYHRDLTLGSILAAPLVEFLVKLNWSVEIVLPVPLGVARLQERGYNQAAILARPIALGAGRVYMSNALFKVKETSTQVGLTYIQRRENVKGAFRATEALVGGRSVLIIDDVATSKATLYACAEALIASGARRVYGLTLARAGHSSTGVA
jgi:ComF family protein